tara:strand:+ start:56 stop:259 length:204 start_codon:yes stop_codon:yes gene_type:complete
LPKKLNTEEFIERAKTVHGDTYGGLPMSNLNTFEEYFDQIKLIWKKLGSPSPLQENDYLDTCISFIK